MSQQKPHHIGWLVAAISCSILTGVLVLLAGALWRDVDEFTFGVVLGTVVIAIPLAAISLVFWFIWLHQVIRIRE